MFAGGRKAFVPNVEGDADLVGEPPPGLPQERVALSQDALDVGSHLIVRGMHSDEAVVEKAAARGRAIFHEREVVGGKDADPQDSEQVSRSREWLTVDLG